MQERQVWRAWHEDDHLVVVDKPAGLLAVPGRGADKQDCLSARVAVRWPDARVVHRLDMATSGLMLFARGALMQRRLNAAFAERRVDKRYVAVVHGLAMQDAGEIDAPLIVDWPHRPRQRIDAQHGRPALTRWRVLWRDAAARRTRLELEPVSGRAHQLRVHLCSIGHAIVGDALYGDDGATEERLLLHACRLAFEHPHDGRPCVFESPPPF
ncbi:MAG: RluA family pseudouridine synthase [Burkholderiales bacterium]|nr:RluA family pseudouridine synthase [Burkholderiales bacterium]